MSPHVPMPNEPPPDPFGGVLRILFNRAGATHESVSIVIASTLSTDLCGYLKQTVQTREETVMDKCCRLVATLFFPADDLALHASFVDSDKPKDVVPTIVWGYLAARVGKFIGGFYELCSLRAGKTAKYTH